MKKIILVLLLSLSAASAQAEPVTAATKAKGSAPGDTYNFYFQKAPGPVTVNQGTTTAAPESKATPANGTTTTEATENVAEEAAEDDGRSIRLNLSYVEIKDGTWAKSGGGLGLTLSYFFSRHFGMSLGIASGSQEDDSKQLSSSGDSWIRFSNSATTKHSRTDLALFGTYYPFIVTTGGTSSLDLGLVGGGIYARKKTETENDLFSFGDVPPPQSQSGAIFFAGPSVAFNFSRRFGMLVDARFGTTHSSSYHAGITAIF